MRKLLFFPFLLLALTATACSGDPIEPEGSATEQPETPGNDNDEDETPNNDGRYLVLYCSRTSNTEGIAQRIGTALGCDFIERPTTRITMPCWSVRNRNKRLSRREIFHR